MDWFGLKDAGKDTVAEAADKLDPLITKFWNGLGWVAHSLLNRITFSVHIELKPLSKQDFLNPPPD